MVFPLKSIVKPLPILLFDVEVLKALVAFFNTVDKDRLGKREDGRSAGEVVV